MASTKTSSNHAKANWPPGEADKPQPPTAGLTTTSIQAELKSTAGSPAEDATRIFSGLEHILAELLCKLCDNQYRQAVVNITKIVSVKDAPHVNLLLSPTLPAHDEFASPPTIAKFELAEPVYGDLGQDEDQEDGGVMLPQAALANFQELGWGLNADIDEDEEEGGIQI